jgi:translation initiation factor IF-2
MRVHELARELGVSSKDLLGALEEMGYGGRTASSSVPDETVARLRASGGKAVPGSKPKQIEVEQLPAKPKRREKEPAAAPAPPKEAAEEPAPAPEGNGQVTAPVEEVAAPSEEAAPAAERGAMLPVLKLPRGSSPQDVAAKTGHTAAEVVKMLIGMGEMVMATQALTDETMELLAHELGYEIEITGVDEEEEAEEEEVDESKLQARPPVVTVMGHVDHGKTLLLDAIRRSDVVSQEFGGITQHIGAYQVHHDGREITFIDTPGHEAFTAMRARGAGATDIVVLVVAADDGVMQQTIEALDHARAAGVPIVVAVNKIDKPEADPTRVRTQLVEQSVVPTAYGGDYEFIDVSAKTRQGLDDLLETILLTSEIQELKANPEGPARGITLEAHLDKGRGPVATVLVQRGTLRVGDAIVSGTVHGKVRALLDENGQNVEEAPPSKPVQVLGWSGVPNAGDEVRVVADDREGRHIAQEREARVRAAELVSSRPPSLAEFLALTREGEIAELNLVVKADAVGNLEALIGELDKLPSEEVRVRVIHRGAGAITENDVALAQASQAVVIGYNVRPTAAATEAAEKEHVDVRLYRVIYEATDDIRAALSGLLAPEERVTELGTAEVRAIFRVPRSGTIAGCYVTRGTIVRGAKVRLVRDGVIIYDSTISSLRRFKDDVREVAEGFECGIGIEGYNDVQEGDIIEAYEIREVARSL